MKQEFLSELTIEGVRFEFYDVRNYGRTKFYYVNFVDCKLFCNSEPFQGIASLRDFAKCYKFCGGDLAIANKMTFRPNRMTMKEALNFIKTN